MRPSTTVKPAAWAASAFFVSADQPERVIS
jgi:hypothetical protein